jgi:S1-C subfamily serine protease
VHPSLRRPRRFAELLIAALAGGAIVLGGAAALGKLNSNTSVVRESVTADGEPAAFSQTHHMSINDVYREAAPGVVHIDAVTKVSVPANPFFPTPSSETQTAVGSGFVIDKAGHIVTNEHVVAGASSVQVSFSDNEKIKARIVGEDAATDIAVLQVSAPARALKPLPLGDSDAVRVGDEVIAIGNPLGYDRSVTSGIVSAVGREIQSPNASPIGHVIQTDAALNHGNSGGPLLNADGQVVGVNAQIAPSASNANIGIGFAIPINTAKRIVPVLEKSGLVQRGYLGVQTITIDNSLSALNLPVDKGALVEQVTPGSPAAKAGIQAGNITAELNGNQIQLGGDIITSVNGKAVATNNDLAGDIAAKKPGQTVKITLLHRGKKRTVTVTLTDRPNQAAQGQTP